LEDDAGQKLCLLGAAKGDFLLWRPSFAESRLVIADDAQESVAQLQAGVCDAFLHNEGAWDQTKGLPQNCNLTSNMGANFTIPVSAHERSAVSF
jgi:hypothetical protein